MWPLVKLYDCCYYISYMFYHSDSIITASHLQEVFVGFVAGLSLQTTRLDAMHRTNMGCYNRSVY
jgi:hypothetical protein